jgi:photosystem II stability/assembly factor-like uncharacterized protein
MNTTKLFRCGLLMLALAAGLPARAAPPALVPAQRVAHAGQAMLLASARAGQRLVMVGEHGVVMLSDDNGRSFRQAGSVPVDSTLTGVSFADARQGWAVGQWGVILATRDGGETWTLQRSDVATDRPLFAVHFLDAQRGVAVGLWSLVLVTADGGAHWQPVSPPAPEGAAKADLNLLGLFADAKGRLYATAEKGLLLRSDDAGQHWRYLATGYKGSFWTGLAATDGSLLAAGLRGSLYRSTDDGRSWARLDTGAKASITGLAAVGTSLVAVGADGLVLRSTDGGARFRAAPRADRLPLTSVIASADGRAVMTTRQGIVSDARP